MDEEDLALSEQLATDRLTDRALVVLADVGKDRLTGRGGRVDHREIADESAVNPISSVRGIGLAVSVRTSTPTFNFFVASL